MLVRVPLVSVGNKIRDGIKFLEASRPRPVSWFVGCSVGLFSDSL